MNRRLKIFLLCFATISAILGVMLMTLDPADISQGGPRIVFVFAAALSP
jgi:hypothetical protein